ncbi:MAG: beta-xylosidase, partial [Microbacterium sp.]|nr:beta-xylosidase [Microbacterium sp.]
PPVLSAPGEVRAGSPISVLGTGFASGGEYVVQLRSTPVDLGIVVADAGGEFRLTATVPADVAPGEHTLVAMQGEADVATLAITITAAPPDGGTGGGSDDGAAGPPAVGGGDRDGELSATGGHIAGVMWTIGIAGALVLAGVAAVRGARRRRV